MRHTLARIQRRQAIARALDDLATLAGLAAFAVAVLGLAVGFGA
jgi:hypothetical protein